MNSRLFRTCVATTAILAIAAMAIAVTPAGTVFTYQGQLKQGGSPPSGPADFQFSLFASLVGGSPINGLSLSHTLTLADGLFTAELDFGAGAFAGDERWLEISVRYPAGSGTYTPLQPRQRLNAAPYALHARNATISGTQDGALDFTNAGNTYVGSGAGLTSLNASNLSTGTLSSGRLSGAYGNALTLSNAGNFFTGSFSGGGSGLIGVNADLLDGLNSTAFLQSIPNPLTLAGTSATYVIRGENASTADGALGVLGLSTAANGITHGLYGQSDSTSGTGVRGLASATTGFNFGGDFATNSTDGRAVRGTALSTTGLAVGGRFSSASNEGIGVWSTATSTTGVNYGGYFHTAGSDGRGVFGWASGLLGTNVTYGVYGQSDSGGFPGGIGVFGVATSPFNETYGVSGESRSSSGTGVYGIATSATGFTFGGNFVNNSVDGRAVRAAANASTGLAVGGRFSSASSSGIGVWSTATAASGSPYAGYFESVSPNGRGIFGYASANIGTNYGVFGASNSGADSAYGVWATGRLGASGVKAFRIDHPDDPENKYLLHYSAESPEVINFYRGTVVLNGAGEAVVELPHYFAKINRDPSYVLTAIGAPMPSLHVAQEIDETSLSIGSRSEPDQASPLCWFRIAGGAPGMKVSWRVEAVRNDRWVQQRGAPVEIEKDGLEMGTYQHPELYGQPPEKGMHVAAALKDSMKSAVGQNLE